MNVSARERERKRERERERKRERESFMEGREKVHLTICRVYDMANY